MERTYDFGKLNEYQRAAVEDLSPACMVKANVGSGKTTVLVSKVQFLHEVQQVPYENMVVLTFTNKAANEIQERLGIAGTPEHVQSEGNFGTFHSVAMNLLKGRLAELLEKKEEMESGMDLVSGSDIGWNREFSVIDPDEELELAEELISEYGLKIKYKNRLKKRLEEEADAFFQGHRNSRYQDDLYRLFPLLIEEKKRQNKMSFSDLIRVCTELLQKMKEQEPVQGANWPAWILVDEVQDSDRQQMEFLLAMKKEETKFFAVGDPNQVIYSWRGGTETMFYEMKHQFQARELSMPVNYRSSAEILEAASRFMQNGGALTGSRSTGDKITVRNHYDPFQEAVYLAGRVKELHAAGFSYREMAVFYRKQNQSEVIEKVFVREEIPFSVSLRKNVKDIPVLDWIIRVLKFSCNEEDVFSGESALMDKVYGEGKTKKAAKKIVEERRFAVSTLYDRMCGYKTIFNKENVDNSFRNREMDSVNEQISLFEQVSLFDQMVMKEDFLIEQKAGRSANKDIDNKEEKTRKYSEEEDRWYRYFSLDEYLHPTSSSYKEDREMVHWLFERIFDGCKKNGWSLYKATSEYLKSAALYGVQVSEKEEGRDAVRLMTLHASKGLEFSHVFLIGVNQGMIPLPGKTPEAEEEERRLFFVGMTRAKDSLELSYYTNPGQPGVLGGPGWYLKMLPGHLLDWPENRGEEEKRNHLQSLRRAVEEKRKNVQGEEKDPMVLEKNSYEQQPEEKTEDLETPLGFRREEAVEVKQIDSQEALMEEKRQARHPKYGTGTVVSEDEMMVEVEFENYGKKQFVKAFSGLTFL